MSKASKEALDDLHATLARILAARLGGEGCTAADLGVARQFLKDNGIDAVAKSGSPLAAIAASLPFPTVEGVEEENKWN